MSLPSQTTADLEIQLLTLPLNQTSLSNLCLYFYIQPVPVAVEEWLRINSACQLLLSYLGKQSVFCNFAILWVETIDKGEKPPYNAL